MSPVGTLVETRDLVQEAEDFVDQLFAGEALDEPVVDFTPVVTAVPSRSAAAEPATSYQKN